MWWTKIINILFQIKVSQRSTKDIAMVQRWYFKTSNSNGTKCKDVSNSSKKHLTEIILLWANFWAKNIKNAIYGLKHYKTGFKLAVFLVFYDLQNELSHDFKISTYRYNMALKLRGWFWSSIPACSCFSLFDYCVYEFTVLI